MDLAIDRSSEISIAEQIVYQIRLLVADHNIQPNQQLPTAKELANTLKLNYNTVAAAYRKLEKQGYVVQNRRAGTRVAATVPADSTNELVAHITADVAQRLGALGADPGVVVKTLAASLALGSRRKPLSVAVLGGTPLEADEAAQRTQAVLGDAYRCVPQTPGAYRSADFHLCMVSPGLAASLAGLPEPSGAPPPKAEIYSAAFPAGAD